MSFARTRQIVLLSLWSLLMANSALAAGGDVGTVAPDFNLPAFGGGNHTLSEHSGQVVLLFLVGYG